MISDVLKGGSDQGTDPSRQKRRPPGRKPGRRAPSKWHLPGVRMHHPGPLRDLNAHLSERKPRCKRRPKWPLCARFFVSRYMWFLIFFPLKLRTQILFFWPKNGAANSSRFHQRNHSSIWILASSVFARPKKSSFRAHSKALRAPKRGHAFCKVFKTHIFSTQSALWRELKGCQKRAFHTCTFWGLRSQKCALSKRKLRRSRFHFWSNFASGDSARKMTV